MPVEIRKDVPEIRIRIGEIAEFDATVCHLPKIGFPHAEVRHVFNQEPDPYAFPDLLFEGVADHPARGVVRQQVVFQVDGLPGPCDVLQEQFPFPFAGRDDLQPGRLRPERQQAAEEQQKEKSLVKEQLHEKK